MAVELGKIEQANKELTRIHGELCHLEKHVDSLRVSLRDAIVEVCASDNQNRPPLEGATLAVKVAELVLSITKCFARSESWQALLS